MRIAQFTESYAPVINGVAVAIDLLTEALSPRHEVEVFAPAYPGHRDDRPIHRFRSYRLPGHSDYPLAFPHSRSVYRKFRAGGFDVVHTHSPFALGQVGRRWARRHGLPIITTYHTLYVEYNHYARFAPRGAVKGVLRELSRRYCEACDAVVVPTEPIREVLREYGVRRPVHVIPTGLKLAAPLARDARVREEFGIPAEAPLVLYAGRLAREKNLDLLFESFGRIGQRRPDAWFLVAGSGPSEQEARRLAKRSEAGARVVFAGFLPPVRMPELYAAADLFAFTSTTDTQGLVLTEAKAAGLPVVSVNAYGPGVVVKDGVDGLLTRNDSGAFSAAVLQLLDSPELRLQMREAALREARRFSIEATCAAYETLYQSATEARRMRPKVSSEADPLV
jgi:1,2-diacylglycerol 3-alpha-glucosyltransferase